MELAKIAGEAKPKLLVLTHVLWWKTHDAEMKCWRRFRRRVHGESGGGERWFADGVDTPGMVLIKAFFFACRASPIRMGKRKGM